jgi:protein-L-isoaspartate(D-aspartate) O-methyltransferase
LAYEDHALPIGHRATISQPYIVALTLQMARPTPRDRLLEVGTGCGYAAAVAAQLVDQVYSMEIVAPLARDAEARLAKLGYENVQVRHGDGSLGWPEAAPFDIIVAAAAPEKVPACLLEQLAPGGRMVIPVGEWRQRMWLITKDARGKITRTKGLAVTFVPMTGAIRPPHSDD